MNAFITGSHAYGTPNKDSDVDLVVRMSKATLKKLHELSGIKEGEPLRFGNLNLIACTNDLEMAVWKVGTAIFLSE